MTFRLGLREPRIPCALMQCPFCGSEQVALSPYLDEDETMWCVICKACAARVNGMSEAQAITAWNTRATSQETAIIEKLWDIIDDIDTADDMAKADDAGYRLLVRGLQAKRWATGVTTDGYTLTFSAQGMQLREDAPAAEGEALQPGRDSDAPNPRGSTQEGEG